MPMRTKVLLFLCFCLFPGISLSQPPEESPVVVSGVLEREAKKPVRLVGEAAPARKSVISSEVSGVVGKMNAEEGRYVKKGQRLAEIRDDKIRLNLRQLRSRKNEAAARAGLSEKNLARIEDLHKKGIVSDGELDRAKAQKDSDEAALESLRSRVGIAEYDLAASKITAPFNGYVTKHHTEAGQWINAGGGVVSLVDIDTIEVTAGLPERYATRVSEGMAVEVRLDSLDRAVVSGEISSIVPDADPGAVSFPVKVVLENPGHRIKSSSSAEITIRIGEAEKIKLVPKDSIVSSPRGTVVFAVREGVAHMVPVRRLGWYEGFAHVEADVGAGESVVVRGNERLMPMQKVKIVDTLDQ